MEQCKNKLFVKQDYPHRLEALYGLVDRNGKILDIGGQNDFLVTDNMRESGLDVTTLNLKNADIRQNIEDTLDIGDNTFDCVLFTETAEHIYFLRRVLGEIKRVLKPGGSLVLSTPNICSLTNRFKMIFGGLPSNCALADEVDREGFGHIRDFNWKLIENILIESGFKVVSKKTDGICVFGRNFFKWVPRTWGTTIILKAVKV